MTPYYADERITLYHGDCREVLPQLELQADCVVTDPPYGETSLAWDKWPDGWPALVADRARSMWCFGSLRMFLDRRDEFAGWKLSQDVVWEKPRGTGLAADRFKRVHELAAHWYRGDWASLPIEPQREAYRGPDKSGARYVQSGHQGQMRQRPYADDGRRLLRTVLSAPTMHGRALHPTEKPLGILDPLISYACPPDGTVLDCFAGSGSTLVAARDSGRRAIGIEADERYCEIIARRVAQDSLFSGEPA